MAQAFRPGDFLVFQLEAGFGLLRVLDIDERADAVTWHLAAYNELFPDVETAESATDDPGRLTVSALHLAITDRAFASTQVARLTNLPLQPAEIAPLDRWRSSQERTVDDRSVRLLLGLR